MNTDQEEYWKHNDAYHARSPGNEEANYHFFRQALEHSGLKYDCSILELGCGTGANLRALNRCYSYTKLTGVDLNQDALEKAPSYARTVKASVLDWQPDDEWDLVITKGLLIHVAPEYLPRAYATILKAASRLVLVCEYFCPTHRMIPYRGQNDRLWARDFAGELIDQHGLKLVDYGFVSKRDIHPQDDLTYWLLEKP